MEKKPRFFIYEGREMGILVLLLVAICAFAFTLGIHMGKRVGEVEHAQEGAPAKLVDTTEDELPNRLEMAEQTKGAKDTSDATLSKVLHDEVAKIGLKIDKVRQIKLPKGAASKAAGKTTLKKSLVEKGLITKALKRDAPLGRFTIQVGSYPKVGEASDQIKNLETGGYQPFVRAVRVRGKGKWYRVYVGGYRSRKEAEQMARGFVSRQVINSFVVANMPQG